MPLHWGNQIEWCIFMKRLDVGRCALERPTYRLLNHGPPPPTWGSGEASALPYLNVGFALKATEIPSTPKRVFGVGVCGGQQTPLRPSRQWNGRGRDVLHAGLHGSAIGMWTGSTAWATVPDLEMLTIIKMFQPSGVPPMAETS